MNVAINIAYCILMYCLLFFPVMNMTLSFKDYTPKMHMKQPLLLFHLETIFPPRKHALKEKS